MVEKTEQSVKKTAATFRLDQSLLDRLDAYADITSLSKTKIVGFALTEYLDNKGKELCKDLMPDWKPKTQEEIMAERIQRLNELYDKDLIFEDDYKDAIAHLTGEPLSDDGIVFCTYVGDKLHTTVQIDGMKFDSLSSALSSGKLNEEQIKRVTERIDKYKRHTDWLNRHPNMLNNMTDLD